MHYNIIYQQLFNFIPRHSFEKSVENLSGDRYCKHFTAWKQFLTCLYAQITGKDSLREIENALLANYRRLYHLGMEAVPKSTLSEAMNRRSPEMFQSLFEAILDRALRYAPKHKFRFKNPLHAIDSTTINLCLNLYDWAHYRKNKGAIKLHTELDLSGNLPCFVLMSNGKMADIRAARENISIVPDSIYTFDKGYYDLKWFQHISNSDAFFVTRIKDNAKIEFLGQHRKPNKRLGILRDESVWFTEYQSIQKYPGELRLVEFRDEETGKTYRFITNHFELAAATIAEIYKQRWQIELFFKWIKQNLRIKSFLGTSENAVMTQIWVALIHYLLVAYIKFLHGFKLSMTELTNRIRDTLMQNLSLLEILSLDRKILEKPPDRNQPGHPELFPLFSG
jgi:transposase